jgi:acetyl-CoA carboxylase carboxyl transferase subunit alpha
MTHHNMKSKRQPRLSPWGIVKISRHPDRPVFEDYLKLIFTNFIELHGDRFFGDDRAIVGGFAEVDGHKIMLIAHNKGKDTMANIERNFGMARPEGYRKALRLMKLAERFGLPVVTIIDTPGAFPGIEAEERGQAESIAKNLTEMASLKVPILAVVIGEGGSGGALGIGVGDRIIMLSRAIYSVISPEGCASILWRDASFAPDAATALNLTASALYKHGIIDEIVREPAQGGHTNPEETARSLKNAIIKNLRRLERIPSGRLLRKRFEKYASIGKFSRV